MVSTRVIESCFSSRPRFFEYPHSSFRMSNVERIRFVWFLRWIQFVNCVFRHNYSRMEIHEHCRNKWGSAKKKRKRKNNRRRNFLQSTSIPGDQVWLLVIKIPAMKFDYWLLSNSFPNEDSKVIPQNPSSSSGRRKHNKLAKRKNAASSAKRLEEKENHSLPNW